MKYSIIVPVYGTEKYIGECLQSLLSQTFKDFEIILVDDHSPDRCPALCDGYAEQDPRVKVIHKPQNEGLGYARNTGIDAAGGSYILFVDSDDTVAPDLLEQCNHALLPQTDILVFGMELRYEDQGGANLWTECKTAEEALASSAAEKAGIFAALNENRLFPYACNKVYRSEFVKTHCKKFEQTKLIEDFLFNIAAFEAANAIQAISPALYYYRKPAHETLASQYSPDFFLLACRKYDLEMHFLQTCGCSESNILDMVRESLMKHLISAAVRNRSAAAGYTRQEQLRQIGQMASNPTVTGMLKEYTPRGMKYQLIYHLIAGRHTQLLWLLAAGVQFMQTKMLPLYRRILK